MKGKLGDKQRLLHMLESIAEIEMYTSSVNIEAFRQNSMMRFASIKQMEIIGEAASHITEETKTDSPTFIGAKLLGCDTCLFMSILA